jgi:hypothetical protein
MLTPSMNTLPLDARYVDKNHGEHLDKIQAALLDSGIHVPLRTRFNDAVFELVRVTDKGVIVYAQEKHGPRYIPGGKQ